MHAPQSWLNVKTQATQHRLYLFISTVIWNKQEYSCNGLIGKCLLQWNQMHTDAALHTLQHSFSQLLHPINAEFKPALSSKVWHFETFSGIQRAHISFHNKHLVGDVGKVGEFYVNINMFPEGLFTYSWSFLQLQLAS